MHESLPESQLGLDSLTSSNRLAFLLAIVLAPSVLYNCWAPKYSLSSLCSLSGGSHEQRYSGRM